MWDLIVSVPDHCLSFYFEVRIEKSVRGSLFGITRLCRVIPNSDPEGRNFLSAPNNYDRIFFLRTFCSPAFDFNVEVDINESRSYTLTSTINNEFNDLRKIICLRKTVSLTFQN